LSKCNIRTR